MVDPTAILIEHLSLEGTALNLLVEDRIHVAQLPEDFDNSQAALLLFCRGGISHKRVPVFNPSYQFKCLGGSELMIDAKAVYLALHDVLHDQVMKSIDSGVLCSAHEETMGQELIDPDTRWPFILTFYSLNVRSN